MKKTVLSIILSAGFFSLASAQIEIKIVGQSTDLTGQTISIQNTTGSEEIIDMEVNNLSGMDQAWKITRSKINVPADWGTISSERDQVCWGSSAATGLCYITTSANIWTTPSSVNVVNGGHGSLIVHIKPNQNVSGSGRFRYYIGTDMDLYQDSVDILVTTTTLTVNEEKQQVGFSIMPNPADNFLTINIPSSSDGAVKITDVLGKEVFEEKINSSKKIDVTTFKNGVYMATLTLNGSISTKRFVVKH